MKNVVTAAMLTLLVIGCKEKQKEASTEEAQEVVSEEKMPSAKNEWTVLFDGKSFEGWHEYNKEGVSENWKIEDGAMVFYPPKERKDGEQFNLVSDTEYTDFELSLDCAYLKQVTVESCGALKNRQICRNLI